MTAPALSAIEATLARLVAYPTVSSAPTAAMAAHLAERLEEAGARVRLSGDSRTGKLNLVASIGPDLPRGGILLSGHMDVVPVDGQGWSRDPFVLAEADGRLLARGSCDMKGFIAACIELAAALRGAKLARPLHFAFTHDEEVGCLGAQALLPDLREHGPRPDLVIVGEPTGMAVIEGHKGCHEYTVRLSGRAGHGSRPETGVNAAEYAARYVVELLRLREALRDRAPEDSRFEPPWSTINVGRITGGLAHNVIAEQAEIDWEMRPVTAGDARFVLEHIDRFARDMLLPEMRAVEPGALIERFTLGEVAGLRPMAENAARDLVFRLTGQNAAGLVPFGTEAGLFQELGADVVVCGPGSIAQAHTPDEFIERAQLAQCAEMLGRLAATLHAA